MVWFKADIYPQNISIFSADDVTASTDNLDLVAVPNGESGESVWDVTGSILFNTRLYNSERSSQSTIRFNEVTGNLSVRQDINSFSNQQVDYQCTGLSTYDLQLIFQLLVPLGQEH